MDIKGNLNFSSTSKKVLLPKGRIFKQSFELLCEHFNLDSGLYEEVRKKDIFTITDNVGENSYTVIQVKPKDTRNAIKYFGFDYAVIANDIEIEFYIQRVYKIDPLKTVPLNARVSFICKDGCRDIIKRIITTYPNIAERKFPDTKILTYNGGLEIYPNLNQEVAIIDVVATGQSLKDANLMEIEKLFDLSLTVYKCDNREVL